MKPMLVLVAAAATAVFLTSCANPASDGHADHQHGSESSAAAPAGSPAPHNAADVTFATGMIPHHEQAVRMAEMVPQRSTDPAVTGLASQIAAEQAPELQTMKAFLTRWNADEETGHDEHDGATNGMKMQGMVDDATMAKLETLAGADFDRLWLQSMIGHHEGAVAMAKTEIADGANADAKTLAGQIVTAQDDEIDQMKKMLGG